MLPGAQGTRPIQVREIDLYDMKLMWDILHVLGDRRKAGILVQKHSLQHRGFERFDFDLLKKLRRCVAEVELPKARF